MRLGLEEEKLIGRSEMLSFAKVLLLHQLCVGVFNPLSFLVQRFLVLGPTRVTVPGAESILAGQGLHHQLHLASTVQVYAGTGVPHRNGVAGSTRSHYVLQEGGIVSETLRDRIQPRVAGEAATVKLEICP